MLREGDGSDISYMAAFLRRCKALGQKTVLVLGSRTGGLFRSTEFYDTMKQFGLPSFDTQSLLQKFGTCYQLLTNKMISQEQDKPDSLPPVFPHFDALQIDTILSLALSKIDISPSDINLAQLIRLGLFDTIVSANVDDMLERAMKHVGMEQERDFYVYSPHIDAGILKHAQQNTCLVMKIFGQFSLNNYTIGQRHEYLANNQYFANWLQDIRQYHLLIVGLDPLWDAELFRILSTKDESFWSIDGKILKLQAETYQMATIRSIWHVREKEDSYGHFFQALHKEYSKHQLLAISTDININPPGNVQKDNDTKHEKLQDAAETPLEIFISCVETDDDHRTALSMHLAALRKEKLIIIWHKEKMLPGDDTKTTARSHLDSAAIILFLVSARFIDSEDADTEVRYAMERQANKSARCIPVILSYCEWQNMPFGKLKPLPTDGKPVTKWDDRDEAYKNIVQGIRTVIEHMRSEKKSGSGSLEKDGPI